MTTLYLWRFVILGNLVPMSLLTCGIVLPAMDANVITVVIAVSMIAITIIYMTSGFVNRYIRSGPYRTDNNKYKSVIGGGWSHFLQKEGTVNATFDTRHGLSLIHI